MSKVKSIAVIFISFCIVVFTYFGVLLVEKLVFYPMKYEQEVIKCSKKYDLDGYLVLSVIKVESSFKHDAVSAKGAMGLMQMLPSTAEFVASKLRVDDFDLFDANTNIEFGCYYLRYLIDKFDDVYIALAAYNAGEGRVSSWLADYDVEKIDDDLSYIKYSETKQYVIRIKKTLSKYKKLYGNLLDK